MQALQDNFPLPIAAKYMLASALAFSIMSLMVKLSYEQGIPIMEILAARSLLSIVFCFWTIRKLKLSLFYKDHQLLLLLRGIVGFIALSCVFYSVSQLPLALATVIQYLNPMFTALLALFFLKEQIHKGLILCFIVSMLGLMIMTNPFGASTPEPLALAAALTGAFLSALAYVIVRKLSAAVPPTIIVLYFPLVALPASLPFVIPDFVMPDLIGLFYLLLVGIFTQLGQIYLTKAMKLSQAGTAMSYSYTQVVFAAVLGFVVLGEVPSLQTWLGAILIFVGVWCNLKFKTKAH